MNLSSYFVKKTQFELLDLNDPEIFSQISHIKTAITKVQSGLNTNLIENNSKKLSVSYGNLIQELHEKISELSNIKVRTFKVISNSVDVILSDIESLNTLNAIADVENTVIFIGANGSGKSSYVSNLKKTDLQGLYVIPAQKYLYFDSGTYDRNEATIHTYQGFINSKNIIELAKQKQPSYNREEFKKALTYPFSYLITALVKEYAEIEVNKSRNISGYNEKTPLWDSLELIWNQLIPNIKFELKPNDRTISILKNDIEYEINSLSDGEKCILFYIGNVLVAPKNGYIVVDEPETFLNPAIYNKLWDLLISRRSDCQFIFTSHTMDFINSRTNSTFVWCKKFIYPDKFELQVLDKDITFPMSLLTELVGSRKPILFCEGTHDSIDYQILSKIFMNQFFVKPVSGHKEVISYTKGYNALSALHGNTSFGLIDGDFMEDDTTEKYQEINVSVLPFNEIEMLLLNDSVINSVLKPFHNEIERAEIIKKFKKEFFCVVDKFQEKILLDLTKKLIDRRIIGCLVEDYSSLNSIEEQIKNIPNQIDVASIYSENKTRLKKFLFDQNYSQVLGFCNLKGQIVDGLGNRMLMSNYKNMALKRISQSNELQEFLRDNIFSENQLAE